jgi:ABC-type sugar transport system permease subunit
VRRFGSVNKWLKRIVIPFLAPAVILYLVFFVYPAVQSLWVSLHDWSGFTRDMKFIGLRNFVELTADRTFQRVLLQSVGLVVIGGGLTLALSLFFTGLLGGKRKGKAFFRIVIFSPNVVTMVALATLWGFIYNPRFGLLNSFLRLVGFKGLSEVSWMGPDLVYWSILVAVVWIYVGFYTILFMAGADKIPLSFYEAARLEGTGTVRMFFTITIPLLWDVISMGIVYWIIDAFMQFEFYYAVSGSFPPLQIWTIPIYVVILAFGKRAPIYRMGYATAVAIVLLVMVVILVTLGRRLMRRSTVEY